MYNTTVDEEAEHHLTYAFTPRSGLCKQSIEWDSIH